MSASNSIVAARLARARQSNKESGRDEVVLTGAAMHGAIKQPHPATESAPAASSSTIGVAPVSTCHSSAEQLDPQQQQMLVQMEQVQQELEQNQQRLEQQRKQRFDPGAPSLSATGPSIGDAGVPTVPAKWLLQPAERDAPMVQCLIKRERSGLGFYPIYRMFLQRDDGDVFILAARRRKGVMSEGHSFLISRDPKYLEKGPSYVGKLRSNLIGCVEPRARAPHARATTAPRVAKPRRPKSARAARSTEWMLYDCGANPTKLLKGVDEGSARRELAYISSQQNARPARRRTTTQSVLRHTVPSMATSASAPRIPLKWTQVLGPATPRRVRVTLPQLDDSGRQPRSLTPASPEETLPVLPLDRFPAPCPALP